jgi:type II secretory pathway pseudopilin PulG
MKASSWLKTIIKCRNKHSSERGFSLIESAVAILLMGGCVLTLVMSMSGGALAVQKDDQEVTAQGLARTQMETVKNSAFGSSYSAVTAPAGYAVSVTVESVPGADTNIQQVIAVVTRDGNTVFTLQDYKVNR